MTGRKKSTPSKLPRPIVWRRKEKRLSRRSDEQQPGEVDKDGTDHSVPVSRPGLSLQPQPQPTSSTPAGSQISLVSTSQQIPVIQSNPWSIFSPRPQRFEKTQSAPTSPLRGFTPNLRRTSSVPSDVPQSPFLGTFSSLVWDSSEELTSPSFLTASNSPTNPNFLEPENTPVPATLHHLDSTVSDLPEEDHMAAQRDMKQADSALAVYVGIIKDKIDDLDEDDVEERGPTGVREELADIQTELKALRLKVSEYSLKVEDAEAADVPVKGGVKHDSEYWEAQLENLKTAVKQHKKRILKKLRQMENAQNAVTVEAEKRKENAEIAKERDAKAEKERLNEAKKAKAHIKVINMKNGVTKLKSILPTVVDWTKASRDEVIKTFKLLPTIQTEFEKIVNTFSDLSLLCHEAGLGENEVNHTQLHSEVEKFRGIVETLTDRVTKEDRKRELHSATGGYKANVPLPSFRGSHGEDWFIFERNLLDAFSRNNVAGPDKFDQLRTCLTGDALRHVPLSVDKNFNQALVNLKNIYGNPLTVMEARTADIKKLGAVPQTVLSSGKNNYSSVVKYCLELEALIKTLLQLAKDHHQLQMDVYSSQTRKLIINQFQVEEIRQIKKKIKNLEGREALEAVREFVSDYREECQDLLDFPSSVSHFSKPKQQQSGANFLQFARNHVERKRKDDCKICHHFESKRKDKKDLYENHSSNNPIGCPKFRNVTNANRKSIIKDLGLCFSCLTPKVPDRFGNDHSCLQTSPRRPGYLCRHQNCNLHMWICPDHIEDNRRYVEDYVRRNQLDLNFKANHHKQTNTVGKEDEERTKIAQIKADMLKEGKTPVDIPSGPALFLLGLLKGKSRPLLTFFDSGASDAIAREGVPGKEVNGTILNKGPFEMTVASNLKVSTGDEWIISLERTDSQHQLFRCITLKEICGKMELINCGKTFNTLKRNDSRKLQNFRVPKTVGGEVDLLLGCRYNNVYPEAVHQFENGLTVYKLKLTSHNKSVNSCLGGPHEAFETFLSGTNIQTTLQKSYLILDAYKRQGPPSIADMVSFTNFKLPLNHGNEELSATTKNQSKTMSVCPAQLRGSEQAEVDTDEDVQNLLADTDTGWVPELDSVHVKIPKLHFGTRRRGRLDDVSRTKKASVNTISQDQLTIQKQSSQIQELELGSKKLKDQLTELSKKLEDFNQGSEESSEKSAADVQKLELRVKDLEMKLDLEKTTKGRMESHIKRQTDVIESLQRDLEDVAMKEKNGQEEQKKLKVSIRSLNEELSSIQNKEKETLIKKSEAEKQLEVVEAEKSAVKNQLKLAQTRIESLQSALKGGDSDDEDEIISTTFLDHHR